jgi:hypothetical protein
VQKEMRSGLYREVAVNLSGRQQKEVKPWNMVYHRSHTEADTKVHFIQVMRMSCKKIFYNDSRLLSQTFRTSYIHVLFRV